MATTLCFATNNLHKRDEIQFQLGSEYVLKTLAEIGCNVDIPETGSTLEENSLLKAKYVFDNFGIECFADDTGLEVAALNNAPGVYSARYAGTGNSEDNINLLLERLATFENKLAQFRTVITLMTKDNIHTFEGIAKGKIIAERKGTGGFGYDAVFVPQGYSTTFAEMDMKAKNSISHRGKAMQLLIAFLAKAKV